VTSCSFCQPWFARTQSQLDNRLRKMRAHPDVKPFACPKCDGTEWASSAECVAPAPSLFKRVLERVFG
jgi:hypothetical protein